LSLFGPNSLNGLLILDKPPGWTSRDAVNRVASVVGRKTRVGHAGTLDPLATGVLVVALGQTTRLIAYVQQMPKTYRAVIRLGGRSDTDDADGLITPIVHPLIPDATQVAVALRSQVGTVLQTPPRYSALKVAGRRAYDRARAGEDIELVPRPVRIDRIELGHYSWPELEIEVDCGAGTYIRSIARDLGVALGCGGYVSSLRRSRTGPFLVEQGLDPRTVSFDAIVEHLRPPRDAVSALMSARLDEAQVRLVRQGRSLDSKRIAWPGGSPSEGEVALCDAQGTLVAIAECSGPGGVAPKCVLADPLEH
jgi:tRNA pseudouridine55 synthase